MMKKCLGYFIMLSALSCFVAASIDLFTDIEIPAFLPGSFLCILIGFAAQKYIAYRETKSKNDLIWVFVFLVVGIVNLYTAYLQLTHA